MHHVLRRISSLRSTTRAVDAWRQCLSTAARSYNDAIDALNTLQTSFQGMEARKKAGIKPDASFVREMRVYLRRIGYSPKDLDRLNIIHVAGTKGKGSTCAYIDSILSQYRRSGRNHLTKTGLFISPHLIAVRERIRINSTPISETLFARYFFDVWDRLGASDVLEGDDLAQGSKPTYGRYLTLMSWHVFLQEGTDAVIYETGLGGEFDATNLVDRPLVAGISSLGIDHVFALGNTIDQIAWHKGGIMKTGSPAFTVEQVPEARAVLTQRAKDKGVDLTVLPIDHRLSAVHVRPDAEFQKKNASLAVALAETALTKLGVIDAVADTSSSSSLPREFVDGIQDAVLRGRCEVKDEGKVRWHLDGAHTIDSLNVAARWFVQETTGRPGPRVMIFNQQGRTEALDFLAPICEVMKRDQGKPTFDHVIFCTNVTRPETGYNRAFVNNQYDSQEVKSMTTQHRFAAAWSLLDPAADVRVMGTIQEAIDYARQLGDDSKYGDDQVQTFVTGSIHLVGGALGILEEADAL